VKKKKKWREQQIVINLINPVGNSNQGLGMNSDPLNEPEVELDA
jgi:hypothetical protein